MTQENEAKNQDNAVYTQLEKIAVGLGEQYCDKLISNGFDTVFGLSIATMDDLLYCTIKRCHARKIYDYFHPKSDQQQQAPIITPETERFTLCLMKIISEKYSSPLALSNCSYNWLSSDHYVRSAHELSSSASASASSNIKMNKMEWNMNESFDSVRENRSKYITFVNNWLTERKLDLEYQCIDINAWNKKQSCLLLKIPGLYFIPEMARKNLGGFNGKADIAIVKKQYLASETNVLNDLNIKHLAKMVHILIDAKKPNYDDDNNTNLEEKKENYDTFIAQNPQGFAQVICLDHLSDVNAPVIVIHTDFISHHGGFLFYYDDNTEKYQCKQAPCCKLFAILYDIMVDQKSNALPNASRKKTVQGYIGRNAINDSTSHGNNSNPMLGRYLQCLRDNS